MKTSFETIVIGGGISGLTAAFHHQQKGKDVLLIEKSQKFGGVIQTEQNDFGIFEKGPNSLALSENVNQLIHSLDIADQVIEADASAQKRYIFLNGKPELISPKTLLFSNKILSGRGKRKLLTERFKKAKDIPTETLGQAIERRFGSEILQKLVNPVVTGIYAGDTSLLEYKSVMTRLKEFETEYGSYTKGFLKSRKKGGTRKIISFKNGLGFLIESLVNRLENKLQHTEIKKITKTENGFELFDGEKIYSCQNLILATPSHVTKEYLNQVLSIDLPPIDQIPYTPILSINLSYPTKKVKNGLDAFGVLFPKEENKSIMGIINYSSIFPQDPNNRTFNLFVSIDESTDIERKIKKAKSELAFIYDIQGEPIYESHTVWKKAIPQYIIGHAELKNHTEKLVQKVPGLEIIGNWKTGVAIGDCIYSGK